MAVGFAAATADAVLDALCRGVAWTTPPAALWVKLHTGDPGAAGTANPALETDRIQAVFGASSSGQITNTSALEWLAVAATEDYTHYSAWDDQTAGTFQFSGTVTALPATVGQPFTVAVGDLVVVLGVAA